ncbi:chordopoxvirus fusion protein [Candidatus Poribacteria bacterium]|nr:chordopoxvirus fusion protein [Candidatus Poribacteria bacterium]
MNTLKIYDELKDALGEQAARAIARVIGDLYESELLRLREGFEKLIESHRQSLGRLDRIEQSIGELAEAQRKTEERLEELAARVDTLAEAQRRTEQRVEELAEAQRKTEERLENLAARVDALAEAQKRTDRKVEELAEAQRRTEEELRKLAAAQRETRRQLGGLAHTVGYRLEDEAFKALPKLLGRDLGAKLVGRLKRDYIEIAPDRYVEINILGRAVKDSKEFVIIGEAKSQLRKRDVDGFIKRCEGLKRFLGEDQIRVLVVYQAPPQVQRYVREKGIMLYFSYDFS